MTPKPRSKSEAKRIAVQKKGKVRCDHYWSIEHTVWAGKTPQGVGVLRYCGKCGLKQMAFTAAWQPAPKSYADVHQVADEAILALKSAKRIAVQKKGKVEGDTPSAAWPINDKARDLCWGYYTDGIEHAAALVEAKAKHTPLGPTRNLLLKLAKEIREAGTK